MSICDSHREKPRLWTRRDMLTRCGSGMGMLALATLFKDQGLFAAPTARKAVAQHIPRLTPRANAVIWLFQEGGPSGFDLFDPKPQLIKSDGQRLPGVDPFFGNPGPLMDTPFIFKQHGQSGTWVSHVMPHIAECVDDICLIKSCHCESNSHAPAMYQMNTGYTRPGFPSAGAWMTYGLGSDNRDLPGFVVLPKLNGTKGGLLNWGSGFLLGENQGPMCYSGDKPILNLDRPQGVSVEQQRSQLDFIRKMNQRHLDANPLESDLETRINSFELAFRMQFEANQVVDLKGETKETRELYGINDEETEDYGTKLLLARRLVERGVRLVQAYPAEEWDAHSNLKNNHETLCRLTDKPVAGLLKDLKRRGLLDTTLVIWGGEFGRLPVSEGNRGRDHNPHGFLMWMAGGGVRGGMSYGETDEFGYHAIENPVSVPDIHATILHLLGLNHEELTYRHNGRDFRLTDVSGNVITPILA